MLSLRPATQTDVPAITALVRAAYTPWISIMGREPGPMGFDYSQWVERSTIQLHHVGDELAALAQMRVAPDHLDLINVAVAPTHQGRGIGRALMSHAEEFARDKGLLEVRLFTNVLMASNRRLYESLGYQATGEEAFRGGTVVHMRKRLFNIQQ